MSKLPKVGLGLRPIKLSGVILVPHSDISALLVRIYQSLIQNKASIIDISIPMCENITIWCGNIIALKALI